MVKLENNYKTFSSHRNNTKQKENEGKKAKSLKWFQMKKKERKKEKKNEPNTGI